MLAVKPCDVSCCQQRYVLVHVCHSSIAGSTGGYVAGTWAAYENQGSDDGNGYKNVT